MDRGSVFQGSLWSAKEQRHKGAGDFGMVEGGGEGEPKVTNLRREEEEQGQEIDEG